MLIFFFWKKKWQGPRYCYWNSGIETNKYIKNKRTECSPLVLSAKMQFYSLLSFWLLKRATRLLKQLCGGKKIRWNKIHWAHNEFSFFISFYFSFWIDRKVRLKKCALFCSPPPPPSMSPFPHFLLRISRQYSEFSNAKIFQIWKQTKEKNENILIRF